MNPISMCGMRFITLIKKILRRGLSEAKGEPEFSLNNRNRKFNFIYLIMYITI
jgi:hypothetical protein